MADREQTRRDAWDLVSILARIDICGFDLVPIPVADANDYANALRALLAELQQAEQRVIDGAWDRSRLVEQLEQTERERDVANDALIETKHQLAKLHALVEAQLERAGSEPLGIDISDYSDEFCSGFLCGQDNALRQFIAAYKQEQDVPS